MTTHVGAAVRSRAVVALVSLLVGWLMGTASRSQYDERMREELQEQRLRIEELETQAAECSLAEFARQAWHIIEPSTPLQWNWHHDAICEHLEAQTWGHIQYLIVNVAPRYTKSTLVSVMHPAWEWIHFPGRRSLTVSSVSTLATRDAVNTRAIIQSPWYQRRWGRRFRLTSDQNVKTYYVNNRRGARLALGLDSNIVGQGGDALNIDDPIDLKEAENHAELQRVNQIWTRSLFSRVNDPKRSTKRITMQRVAENDLCGHVRDQHDWTWLILPTVFEAKARCRTFYFRDEVRYTRNDEGRRERTVVATRRITFTDPRKRDGELLWPSRFDQKAIDTARKQGSFTFQAQQQQQPVSSEGTIVKRHWIRYYHPDRPPTRKIAEVGVTVDPSLKAKQKNDPWAMQAWARVGADAFLLKQEHGRFEYAEAKRKLKDLVRWVRETYPSAPMVTLVEPTAAGPELIAELKRELPGLLAPPADVDKERRLRLVSPYFESGNVFVPGFPLADGSNYDPGRTAAWVTAWVDEIVSFPNVDHDDQMDAMTQMLRRFQMQAQTTSSGTSGGTTSGGESF